ncbi:TolC family protein [Candidatus Uabimicrobium amorphum]|uniref:RND transporter n=1 Tax=Uabimicrobium amorphum TaxID=2596890 RepID=A0A5S9IMN8_UABAM|nr:TolC family protein [Candidatus Uabimicrobium amorphum]BBM84256.1 RND transporter [Candidatus Uabimicrobium amorphum]
MFCCKILLFIIVIFSGCQSYKPQPIIPRNSLSDIEKSRNTLLASENLSSIDSQNDQRAWNFSFIEAAKTLKENSPSLKQARSEYKKELRQAEIKTPLPNPQLQTGVIIGSNLGDDSSGRVQPLVSFGFTIPLSKRLSRQDEVNSSRAKYAYMKYLLQHRSEYLKLRRYYIELILLENRKTIHKRIVSSIQTSINVTQKLIDAGVATALDIGIVELELLEKQSQLAKVEGEMTKVRGKLSQILGVSSKFLVWPSSITCPKLPKSVPELAKLKAIMLENNSSLALLQATYEIAEKELHLQITKQTPDITLTPSFEGDPGQDTNFWGVAVSFRVPIFDQNQRAIALKESNRELVKVQYNGALSNALAFLETSYQHYLQQQQRFQKITDIVLQKSKRNVGIALETLKRGEVDFLKYIDSERSLRNILLDVHEAKTEMYKAWLNMETVMGMPIWLLPEEQQQSIPSLSGKQVNEENTPRDQPGE